MSEQEIKHRPRSKVPEIAMGFWIIKIAATSLGWTAPPLIGGNLGERSSHASLQVYLFTAAVAAIAVLLLVYMQVKGRKFDRWMYWLTFVVTTICAASVAGVATLTSTGAIPVGAIALLACFGGTLFAWRQTIGEINVEMVADANAKAFYWFAIFLAQSLGFQLGGDVAATGLGYAGAAALFGLIVAAIGYAHFKTSANELLLFWGAFVLTCPLSGLLADFLFKPLGHGGLALTPIGGSVVLLLAVAALIYILPPRSAGHAKEGRSKA